MTMTDYLSSTEAADLLGLTIEAVQKMCGRGVLAHRYLGAAGTGGRLLVLRADVLAEKKRRTATPEHRGYPRGRSRGKANA